ncbi:MAG: stage sporulation protein [Clostridia bacterium]|nr:stage sporulation protein [Clostridia bacterium]
MVKMLGGGLVILTCSILGLEVARSFSARIEQLRQFNAGLKMLETEIAYGATPLPLALARVGKHLDGPVALFFQAAARKLREDPAGGALAAWEEGLKELSQKGALRPGDREIIRSLGPMLGNSTADDQVKNLELTRQLVGQQQLAALEENNRQGKMWRTLGFLLGVTLVLLLY